MSWISVAWDWYAAHSDKVNPVVAGLGGAALVWAAVRQARTATNRHYEQTRADQQRRLTESFSKAVEQLASDKMEMRLGGIYTLERLALEAILQVPSPPWWRRLRRNRPPNFRAWWWRLVPIRYRQWSSPPAPRAEPVSGLYWTVLETLTAFVRERAKWQEPRVTPLAMSAPSELWQSESRSDEARSPPTDIAAVLEVIRRRPEAGRTRERQHSWYLNLRGADLRGADLVGAHLHEGGAHLEGVDLVGAHLEGAILTGAHLTGAVLERAHLERSDLRGAHFEHAYLFYAHLEGVDLRRAHLEYDNDGLDTASGDAETRLPKGYPRPKHWPAEAPEFVLLPPEPESE